MPIERLNEIDLYYERSGAGPRLMFFNGSGSTLATAAALVSVLANQFDVVAFDQRGLGRSGLSIAPYSMADLADDAIALADHLGWEHFRVMGVSFGGMVALELAVTIPDRIERIALLCTSSGGAGGSSYPLHTLKNMDSTEMSEHLVLLCDTRFTSKWLEDHRSDYELMAMQLERLKLKMTPEEQLGEALQMQARVGHDVYERLPRIDCPTFVASGRTDGIAPRANSEAIGEPTAKCQIGHLRRGSPLLHSGLDRDSRNPRVPRERLTRRESRPSAEDPVRSKSNT